MPSDVLDMIYLAFLLKRQLKFILQWQNLQNKLWSECKKVFVIREYLDET